MYSITNTDKGPNVVHDRRGRPVTIEPGTTRDVDLADDDARRYHARGGVLKVRPAEVRIGPVATEKQAADSGEKLDAADLKARAAALANGLADKSVEWFAGLAEAKEILGGDDATPNKKIEVIAALRAFAAAEA